MCLSVRAMDVCVPVNPIANAACVRASAPMCAARNIRLPKRKNSLASTAAAV